MTRQAPLTGSNVIDLCLSVFADNLAAGWWTDLTTGARLQRNVGELLMLCVSELCEAAEGLADRLMDDKLPHRQMVEVELADFCIRVFDFGGGLSIAEDLGREFDALPEQMLLQGPFSVLDTPEDYLLRIIRFVSDAMEYHRKGRAEQMALPLAYALHGILMLGEILSLDVLGAIVEKREFNKTREDHQIETRRAAGGKAY